MHPLTMSTIKMLHGSVPRKGFLMSLCHLSLTPCSRQPLVCFPSLLTSFCISFKVELTGLAELLEEERGVL